MNSRSPVPKDKKLTVVFRVEHGCLGPQGKDHVERFCDYAQQAFASTWSDFVDWEIIPRESIAQPEIQYEINKRRLDRDKAGKYLAMFSETPDALEGYLHDKAVHLIEEYMAR